MASKIKVEKWDDSVDGTLSVEAMEKKLRKQGYHCTQYQFSPGTNFPDHTHSISKKDSIVTGQFQFCMYGETIILKPGDMVEVPKNTVHNAKVVGNESVVFFDATK
ncbi:uncharacterized protein LOC123534614 [Mercenaria mercenaria]|uniref:uncharacterized protein LOC123534614 n=1 Tax=Mercenaria mercenaria TaxID=6596 RepID=UPI001E1D7598|nr:uncharacterized protein LOC123534614 [Mercenaria mercenaria]